MRYNKQKWHKNVSLKLFQQKQFLKNFSNLFEKNNLLKMKKYLAFVRKKWL